MASRARVPKVLGGDIEFANSVMGLSMEGGTGPVASRRLLAAVKGVRPILSQSNPQDWGRTYLPSNGGCVYIDSDHFEVALPETRSAVDYVAQWRAAVTLTQAAMREVNASLPAGHRVQVLANCSDGLGHAYGSHVSVLLTRAAWDTICRRHSRALGVLAAFQASSFIFTGQGKVGAECGRPACDFQISQRADFLLALLGLDTMVRRSLVNTRDEPLCGSPGWRKWPARDLARLHVICYDTTLCEVATFLRAGTLQVVVAMLEAGWTDPACVVSNPVAALGVWSRDLMLGAAVPTDDGRRITAVDLQCRFVESARRFVAAGGCDGLVPDADRILALWEDTVDRFRARDFDGLSRRLDWLLKRRILQAALARHPELSWRSPPLRHLDQMYASLDTADGLFWNAERAGAVERITDDQTVAQACAQPPDDTRAWSRAQLLRRLRPEQVLHVDWDHVRVRRAGKVGEAASSVVVPLPVPFGHTRADNQGAFDRLLPMTALLRALNATQRAREAC